MSISTEVVDASIVDQIEADSLLAASSTAAPARPAVVPPASSSVEARVGYLFAKNNELVGQIQNTYAYVQSRQSHLNFPLLRSPHS